ncbi:MAG: nuclear transport factor 2 family protein, partial [Dehalococcoidia bacterium]|nr:nuclear transport factor 2 family protein [Dehalococcoidia bacterium]
MEFRGEAMNRDQFLEYIDHFNNKRYDAVTSYFAPDVTVEYFTDWASPQTLARTLHGRQEFIDSYRTLHEHVREVLELGDFMVSENLLFAELYTEFHCFKDYPTFIGQPLRKGDVVIMTNWVLYNLEGGKM